MTVMRFVAAADCSQSVVIALGLLFAVFFVGFVIAVVYIIYLRRKLQGMSQDVASEFCKRLFSIYRNTTFVFNTHFLSM